MIICSTAATHDHVFLAILNIDEIMHLYDANPFDIMI